MEKIFFDPTTGWFLGSKTHKGKIPDNAVPISAKLHRDILAECQATPGGTIIADADGNPVVAKPDKAPRFEAVKSLIKREAGRRIALIFPITAQMNAMREGRHDEPLFAAVDAIRAASDMIEQDLSNSDEPDDFPIADHPLWPENMNHG